MRKFQKLAMMFLLGTVTLGFTACSDNDDNDGFELPNVGQATVATAASDLEMQKITKTYVSDVVYPTYQALAANARTLYTKCRTLYTAAAAGTMTQTQINEACEAFKDARMEWERSEAFLYGSAENNEIDPHIDSWPLDHDQLASALTNATLIAGFKGDAPDKFVSDNNTQFQSVLGFHGMEFVLFRDGRNRTVAELNANDTYEDMTSVKGIDELAFLAAVAGDVKNMTALLEFTWMGEAASAETKQVLRDNSYVFAHLRNNGMAGAGGTMCYGQYLLSPSANSGYYSWPGTMSQILKGGCSNICSEVFEQKLGQAYRVVTGQGGMTEDGEKESKDYIESPYSHRSFIDYKDNIYSIKNSLYGTRNVNAAEPAANSIMAYLKANNADLYSKVNTALNEALTSLDEAMANGNYFVKDPGAAVVKNAIDKIEALDNQLGDAADWFGKQTAK